MKHYELVYLTRQEMTEEEAKKLQEKLADFIKSKQGTITEIQKAYKKKLAYPVKKQEAAYVCSVKFQISGQDLLILKEEVRKDNQILRSLIVAYIPVIPRQPLIAEQKTEARPEQEAGQTPPDDSGKQIEEKPAAQEEKPAEKSRARREKIKADLNEIGEKLDEILK
jgi:ribosomal protein S6